MKTAKAQAGRTIEKLKVAWMWTRAHAALVVLTLLSISVAVWLREHDAHLEREFQLDEMRRQTSAEVRALRARAEAAMKEFGSNAQVIRALDARRTALEREAAELRRRLASLREEERVRVQQASTLGHVEMSGRAASRLDPGGSKGRDSELATRDPEIAIRESREWKLETGNSKFENRNPKVVSHPLSVATEDGPRTTENLRFQIPDSRSGQPRAADRQSQTEVNLQSAIDNQQFPFPSPAPRVANPELDACREQSAVQDLLIANCEERGGASQAVIDALNRSIADLQQGIRAKDAIAARLDAQHRAELRAARGSRLKRFGRALEYVGVGIVIGVVAR